MSYYYFFDVLRHSSFFSPLISSNSCRNTLTDEGIELVLTIMEAKELIGPSDAEKFDTFVRIYMIPEETPAQQTKVSNIDNSFHFIKSHLSSLYMQRYSVGVFTHSVTSFQLSRFLVFFLLLRTNLNLLCDI